MEKQFYSKALEVNLDQTKQEHVELPDDHKWLLSLSEKHWGINKYTVEFFDEFHHRYSNYEHLSKELRKIALGDFWLYSSSEDAERALKIISSIIYELTLKSVPDAILEQLIQIRIDFCANMAGLNTPYPKLLIESVENLDQLLTIKTNVVLVNSVYIRQKWNVLSDIDGIDNLYFDFLKKISSCNLDFWHSSMKFHKWLLTRQISFSEASVDVLSEWGDHAVAEYHVLIEKSKSVQELSENVPLYSDFANHFRKLAASLLSP